LAKLAWTKASQTIKYYNLFSCDISGWVVGSLEILGSPTGLVRSIGNGIADMFRMPYEGFTRGPGAFVGGVTRGMGSLLKHVSTGMLLWSS
jgi:vacuolar protein sorting-associated protein 13B